MFQKIAILIIFLFSILSISAGAQKISDSHTTVLSKKDLPVEDRIMTMSTLAWSKSLDDVAGGIRIAEEALRLGDKVRSSDGKAFTYSILIGLYYFNHDMQKAQQAVDSSVWYADKSSSKKMKGIVWNAKSRLENRVTKRKESVNSSLTALKYLEGTNSFEANAYNNLAGIYAEWHDLPNQRKYAQLCLSAAKQSNSYNDLADAYFNLGVYYHYQYKVDTKKKVLLDSSFLYYRNAIKIFAVHGDNMVYRIKLKLRLNKGEELDDYIRSLSQQEQK